MTLVPVRENKIPSFHSYDLHSVIHDNAKMFDLQKESVAAMSEDIVSVEKYLQSKLVVATFSMRCLNSYRDADENPHFLEWCEDEHGKFRLQCGIDSTIPSGPNASNGSPHTYRERKPLIETQVAIRTALYPCLKEFIENFANYLAALTPESLPIPF